MAIVEVIDKKYRRPDSIANLIRYATNHDKTHGLIGAIGTNPIDVDNMISQMMNVKIAFDKLKDYRQARHIVISFDEQEKISPEVAFIIAYEIARFYADRYQICFGVHLNTENIHIHFIQNTVSYVDGKLFSGAFWELSQFKAYVNMVIGRYLEKDKAAMLLEFENDTI